VSRRPAWTWNADLLDRYSHLVQGDCSLLCGCLLFTLSPFPAICSASLSWRSGKDLCHQLSSCQLQVLCWLPVAGGIRCGDCQEWSIGSGSISCIWTVTMAFAEYSKVLLSGQSGQSTLYLEQAQLEGWLVKLAGFLEKKVYCSASKSDVLLENGCDGSDT